MKVLILGIDGYLGWPLALHLKNKGHYISGIDNLSRRQMVSEVGYQSVVPIPSYGDRMASIGIDEWYIADTRDALLGEIMAYVKPEVIVHYAEIPSASYSMIDLDHALKVQDNNVMGTLRLLWLMKDNCSSATLVKLGTMGEYHPSSFYHVSKVQDSVNIKFACETWGLRAYDIFQGIIYGHIGEGNHSTRLDIDEHFGTVVHRMVAQAVSGQLMTIYGKGKQVRGFIAIQDSIKCIEYYVNHPLKAGEYRIVNQRMSTYTIQDIANEVQNMGEAFDLTNSGFYYIPNPRVELNVIKYDSNNDILGDFGLGETVSLKKGIAHLYAIMTRPEVKERIDMMRDRLLPETKWNV